MNMHHTDQNFCNLNRPVTGCAVWSPLGSQLARLVSGFDPISLMEMDAVALLNRVDVKYVMTTGQLLGTLAAIQNNYRILTVAGTRLNQYRTLYFDTPDFALYQAHVNGQAERYKVRSREYVDTHLAFLEVKHKTRKDRTIKKRIATRAQVLEVTPDLSGWVQRVSPLDGMQLEPKLWNTFTRITLVSKHGCERVTLDVNLKYYNGDEQLAVDGIAIAEVKTAVNDNSSVFAQQMRSMRILPHGFSKYSMGISLLYPHVKRNAMKPKMLWLQKLQKKHQNGATLYE